MAAAGTSVYVVEEIESGGGLVEDGGGVVGRRLVVLVWR